MEQNQIDLILASIKTDNEKDFKLLIEKHRAYNICFGRFPLLSVLYLYDSRKIIKKHIKRLIRINEYSVEKEPLDVFLDFSSLAKKSLRLYVDDEKISFLEILLLKGETVEFAERYETTFVSEELKTKLNKINLIETGEELEFNVVKYENRTISTVKVTKRELVGERKLILKTSLIVFLCTFIIALSSTIFSITSNLGEKTNPIKIKNNISISTAFSSTEDMYYVLEKDLTLNLKQANSKNFSGNFNGNNKTLTLTGKLENNFINEFNGSISNLNIIFKNATINKAFIELIGVNSTLDNVNIVFENTVIESEDNLGVLVNKNTGTISSIKMSGNVVINAIGEYSSQNTERFISLLSYSNNNQITNVEQNVNIQLNGVHYIDYIYASLVGLNSSEISNITVNSVVVGEYFDIGGVVNYNSSAGYIENVKVNSNINYTCGSVQWNPMVAGICLYNYGNLLKSSISGNMIVNSTSTSDISLRASGISIINYGLIKETTSSADITCNLQSTNKNSTVYVSGICFENYSSIQKCKNTGNLTAISTSSSVYMGGICAKNLYIMVDLIFTSKIYPARIETSISECKITAKANTDSYIVVGGICAYNYFTIENCIAINSYDTLKGEKSYIGGILGFYNYVSDEQEFITNNNYLQNEAFTYGIGASNKSGQTKLETEEADGMNKCASEETLKNMEEYW